MISFGDKQYREKLNNLINEYRVLNSPFKIETCHFIYVDKNIVEINDLSFNAKKIYNWDEFTSLLLSEKLSKELSKKDKPIKKVKI